MKNFKQILFASIFGLLFTTASLAQAQIMTDDEKRQAGEYTDYNDDQASGGKQGADHHSLPSNCHCDLNNKGSEVIGGSTPFTQESFKPVGSGLTVQGPRNGEKATEGTR